MLMAEAAPYRRFRAPQADGQTLVDPPRPTLAALVTRNRQHLAALDDDVQGRSLADLAAAARRSLVEAAVAYTSRYRDLPQRDVLAKSSGGPLILSGHQPQLFHAGVWYKNFVLGDLAKEVGGTAIHLLIDSDLCRTVSIRVPTGTPAEPRVESVPFDSPVADMPYEERSVDDEATFRQFSARVVELLRPLVPHPMIEELWPLVCDRTQHERNLGLRIAQGRHLYESRWGNDTLELPQSGVCGLPEFHWFVAHLLAHLPRFWAAHNDALAAYRRAHALRNRAQPVPDLTQCNDWLEAPFWLWTADDPHRRAVFARQRGAELQVSDGHKRSITLTLTAEQDADRAAEQLADLAARGIKLRTRALATTLFARLMLGDLFVHGIGGAKYDQVTDGIARGFFGFSLPEFATASATLRLPIQHAASGTDQLRGVRQSLRELTYRPERFLSPIQPSTTAIIAEKQHWLQTPKTPQNAALRHQGITAANAALQPFTAPQREQLERERETIEHRLSINAILDSREYSFCLFPRDSFERLLRA